MARQQLPRRRNVRDLPKLPVLNPGKGLNNFISDSLIQDTEASDLLNIQFTESGCPSKSYGFTAVGTGLTNAPKGLGTLYTTSSRKLLTVDGTQLKYLNGSTWTAISGASFTSGAEVTFVQARDTVYIWNGTDAGRKYDGTTLSVNTKAPSAAFGIFYEGFQIVSGVSTQPNRLYISVLSDASDFTNDPTAVTTGPDPDNSTDVPGATDFTGTGTGTNIAQMIDVAKGDGDRITALAKFQEKLIIFKERSIYQMTFDSSGVPVLDQITAGMGCVSHKSVDNVDNDLFFLSRTGYFVLGNEPNYNAAIRTNELSSRIKPVIDTIASNNNSKVCAIFSNFKFYTSIPSGGTSTNNKTLVYDKRYLAWSVLDHIKANSFTEFIDSSNAYHLYFASDTTNEVYEIDTSYSANGTAINSYWTSKAFDLGNFEIYKRWVDITFLFRQIVGTVTITIYSDNNTVIKTTSISSTTSADGAMGTQMLGEQILGGSGSAATGTSTNNVPYRVKVNTKSRTIKVKISNSNDNESFTLLGMVFTYVPYSHYSFPSTQKIY